VIHAFNFQDGQYPTAKLVFDASGNLYGTTNWGGNVDAACRGAIGGCGVLFELSPIANGEWKETSVRIFNYIDGASPGGIAFDIAGNLYGTTFEGGPGSSGTVFRLTPNSDGGWTAKIIHAFYGGAGGGGPAGITFDVSGKTLFSTAGYGGDVKCSAGGGFGCGLIFALEPQ
jgi:uncharacterized repeat protein (TIGR03803 family)